MQAIARSPARPHGPSVAAAAVVVAGLAAAAAVPTAAVAQTRDQIRIVGSSTVFPFTTAVAEAFGRSGRYKTPVVESTGTGGGLKLFCAGVGPAHPDIADASRRIRKSEADQCAANGVTAVTELKIGYDGIALASSKRTAPAPLSTAILWRALAKEVPGTGAAAGRMVANPYRLWSDIDPSLPKAPIEVLGPPPTSGTRDTFNELVMLEGCRKLPDVAALIADETARERACMTIREDGAYVEVGENDNLIVQKLGANPGAFGVFGYSYLDQNRDSLQAARMDGVELTPETVAAGRYELSRPLYIYVKNAHAGVIPGIRDFIREYTSERALGDDGYLLDKGLIPEPTALREAARVEAVNLTPFQF
ncbi:PstS family phosphate ABC transporter substrate-binding protein [Azospirillum picis]|nr:PstS family phosphate ABC transporter substrate-binding protein [Azospirillum picis]